MEHKGQRHEKNVLCCTKHVLFLHNNTKSVDLMLHTHHKTVKGAYRIFRIGAPCIKIFFLIVICMEHKEQRHVAFLLVYHYHTYIHHNQKNSQSLAYPLPTPCIPPCLLPLLVTLAHIIFIISSSSSPPFITATSSHSHHRRFHTEIMVRTRSRNAKRARSQSTPLTHSLVEERDSKSHRCSDV